MHLLEFLYGLSQFFFPQNRTDCNRYIPEIGEPNYLHISFSGRITNSRKSRLQINVNFPVKDKTPKHFNNVLNLIMQQYNHENLRRHLIITRDYTPKAAFVHRQQKVNWLKGQKKEKVFTFNFLQIRLQLDPIHL